MKKQFLLFAMMLFTVFNIQAQILLEPSVSFSHKKTAYITLNDGTEIKGTIKDIDRKKTLIDYIKVKDGSGKKHKLKPEDVKYMYLPTSNLQKYSDLKESLKNVKRWTNESINQELINKGYVYFEQVAVKMKKKDRTMLMQLLNPSYSKYVKVYANPKGGDTMSLGVAGLDIVGGIQKSYYISKGNEQAFLMKKKHYKNEFVPFWNNNATLISEFQNPVWRDFNDHILRYTELKSAE